VLDAWRLPTLVGRRGHASPERVTRTAEPVGSEEPTCLLLVPGSNGGVERLVVPEARSGAPAPYQP